MEEEQMFREVEEMIISWICKIDNWPERSGSQEHFLS